MFGFARLSLVRPRLDSAVLATARRCFVKTRLGSVALGLVGARLDSESLGSLVGGLAEFCSSRPGEGSAALGFFRRRHRALPLGSSGNVVHAWEQGKGEGARETILGRAEG